MNEKQRILDQSLTQEERIQAAFQLENSADEESIIALGKALETDPSPIVRHECAFSLGETACPKLANASLRKACKEDKNIFVRHEALLALATLGDQTNIYFIEEFLNDKDAEIRESAEIALQRLQNKKA